jgi:hypothetical protein
MVPNNAKPISNGKRRSVAVKLSASDFIDGNFIVRFNVVKSPESQQSPKERYAFIVIKKK